VVGWLRDKRKINSVNPNLSNKFQTIKQYHIKSHNKTRNIIQNRNNIPGNQKYPQDEKY
jgi:hypothetical protein